jgi:hypothetical protein
MQVSTEDRKKKNVKPGSTRSKATVSMPWSAWLQLARLRLACMTNDMKELEYLLLVLDTPRPNSVKDSAEFDVLEARRLLKKLSLRLTAWKNELDARSSGR